MGGWRSSGDLGKKRQPAGAAAERKSNVVGPLTRTQSGAFVEPRRPTATLPRRVSTHRLMDGPHDFRVPRTSWVHSRGMRHACQIVALSDTKANREVRNAAQYRPRRYR